MPDKTKLPRPKMKVEEISEEGEGVVEKTAKEETPFETETENAEEKVTEEASDETPSETLAPKITSFSQLDAQKKASQTASADVLEPAEKPEKSSETEAEAVEEKESPEKKDKEEVSSSEIKEWLKEVRPDTSKESIKSGGPNTKIIFVIAVILLILGALVGGVLYYRQSLTVATDTQEEEQKPTATPKPTEVPEENVDISTLSVSILNGSGIAGEAKKVKDLLVEAGWTDDKLTTGNADSSKYTETSVSLKKELSNKVFDEVKNALGDSYNVEKSDTQLGEDSSYDLIIILGKEK